MAAWQGPALYAYNDAMFSPHDFQAISRIGQDSKLGNPAATGTECLGWGGSDICTDLVYQRQHACPIT